MSLLTIVIPGEPVAQGRPKFANRGKFVTVYDPPKSKKYKSIVASAAMQVKPEKLMEGPLHVEVHVYKGSLKSFSKKKAELAENKFLRPTTKPDADNYAKGIIDALKGIIWHDDGQVVDLITRKYYSAKPRAEVFVRTIDPQQEKLF